MLSKLVLSVAVVLTLFGGASAAENYPSRSVRMIVPFGSGGANDIVARFLARGLGERWGGQSVIVENRAGAGSQLGTAYVAGAKADGYTLLFDSPAYTTLPAIKVISPTTRWALDAEVFHQAP